MNFTKFPRRRYIDGPTPLEPMPRLSKALGGKVDLWIKRDDLLPGAAGGNKTRKLEFLIGEALEQGANSLVTCGAPQSNHCRLTLSWARKEGLDCHLVLEERVPGSYNPKAGGNNFLFRLMGASSVRAVPGGSDMTAEMQKTAGEIKQSGKRPYIIPGGGSNATGALGYALFAEEFMGQLNEGSLNAASLVVPSGSAGTHAGIVAGFFATHADVPVTAMNISRAKEAQEALVYGLALNISEKLCLPPPPRDLVVCHDNYVGDGYSLPTESMKEAVLLFARQEGILLDPVYSGKAAAGLIDFVRKGKFAEGSAVVFLHTGGDTALFVYQDYLV